MASLAATPWSEDESPGFADPPFRGSSDELNSTGPLPLPQDSATFEPHPYGAAARGRKAALPVAGHPQSEKGQLTASGSPRLLTSAKSTSPLFRKMEAVSATVPQSDELAVEKEKLDDLTCGSGSGSGGRDGTSDALSKAHTSVNLTKYPPPGGSSSSSTTPSTPLQTEDPDPAESTTPPAPPSALFLDDVAAACANALRPYAEVHYNVRRGGLLKRGAVPLDRVLLWKPRCISTSLTKLPPALEHEAVCCFKSVLAFMGDRSSGTSPAEHAGILAAKAMHYSPALLDELYCQVCKQTTGNPDPVSATGGWQLLLALLAVTEPGPALAPCLLDFARCTATLTPTGCQARSYAAAAVVALEKMATMEPRQNYLTHEELRSIITLRGVAVFVQLVNATPVELRVDSWTTVGETAHLVASRLQLGDAARFRLFEETGNGRCGINGSGNGSGSGSGSGSGGGQQAGPGPLAAAKRILDVTARWSRLEHSAEGCDEPRLVYRAHLLLPPPPEDEAVTEMMFMQAVHDFTSGEYPPPSLPDAVRLAALQLQQEVGDELEAGRHAAHLKMHLLRFLPEHWLLRNEEAALVQQILAVHSGLRGTPPHRARLKYLEAAARQNSFGHRLFRARQAENGVAILLGIGARGIIVLDAERPTVELARLPYADLLTWSCSAKDTFSVTVREHRGLLAGSGNGGGGSLMAFTTQEGGAELAYSLVQEYMDLLREEGVV